MNRTTPGIRRQVLKVIEFSCPLLVLHSLQIARLQQIIDQKGLFCSHVDDGVTLLFLRLLSLECCGAKMRILVSSLLSLFYEWMKLKDCELLANCGRKETGTTCLQLQPEV